MRYTLRDYFPYWEMAEFERSTSLQFDDISEYIVNMFPYREDLIKGTGAKPVLVSVDGALYIKGSLTDVIYASWFIKNNPSTEYEVQVFTGLDQAREKYEAVYGYDPEFEDFEDEALGSEELEECLASQEIFEKLQLNERKAESIIALKEWIRDYVSPRNAGGKIKNAPLLIGHSGISKSAMVHQAVEELDEADRSKGGWGFRVVEIKAGFLDKADILGFSTPVRDEQGDLVSGDSPNKDLLISSDAFIEECRKFLTPEPEKTDDNDHLIKKLRYYAKTPVMFLDEVNRAPASVLNQIMRLINASKIRDYSVAMAPKIAAANVELDIDPTDFEKSDLFEYLVNPTGDFASAARFYKLPVSHTDRTLMASNLNWQLKKAQTSLSKQLLENAFDNDYLYDPDMVDDKGKFPTLRGWEYLAIYFDWIDNSGERPLYSVVSGLVGINAANRLAEDNSEIVWNRSESTDLFIEHNMSAGLPTALLGRLGVAKTAKLNKYAEATGGIVSSIDLSAMDRVQMSGTPSPDDFLETLFEQPIPAYDRDSKQTLEDGTPNPNWYDADKDKGLIDSADFRKFYTEAIKNPLVPKKTTRFTADMTLQNQVREAEASGKKLILYFDEFNRCNDVVQSSIFEAISNKRLMGVDLSEVEFTVVAAGNWQSQESLKQGIDYYGMDEDIVRPVDTASLHRFSTKFIETVLEEDLDSFLDYTKKRNPKVYSIFSKIEKGKLLGMLNSDPEAVAEGGGKVDITGRVFTFREIEGLESDLNKNDMLVVSGFGSEDFDAVIQALQDSEYLLNQEGYEYDPFMRGEESFYRLDEMPHLRPYYAMGDKEKRPSAKMGLSTQEFVTKSWMLLEHPELDEDIKLDIKSLIDLKEGEVIKLRRVGIENNIPTEMQDFIKEVLKNYMEDNTLQRLGISEIDDLYAKDRKDVEKAARKMNDRWAAAQGIDVSQEMLNAILEGFHEQEGKVKTSKIAEIIDVLNNIDLGGVYRVPVPRLAKELSNYEDKIDQDQMIDLEFEIPTDAALDETDRDMLESLMLEDQPPFDRFGDSENLYMVSTAVSGAGDNKDSSIGDAWSYKFGSSRDSETFTFDDSALELKKLDIKPNPVSGTYTPKNVAEVVFEGKIAILKVRITVKGAQTGHEEDSIAKQDISLALGADRIKEVFGGSLKDLPDPDVKSLDDLGIKPTENITGDLGVSYLKITKKLWKFIDVKVGKK